MTFQEFKEAVRTDMNVPDECFKQHSETCFQARFSGFFYEYDATFEQLWSYQGPTGIGSGATMDDAIRHAEMAGLRKQHGYQFG